MKCKTHYREQLTQLIIEISERKKNLDGFFVDAMEGKKSHFINTGGSENYQNLLKKFELEKIYNSFEKLISS